MGWNKGEKRSRHDHPLQNSHQTNTKNRREEGCNAEMQDHTNSNSKDI